MHRSTQSECRRLFLINLFNVISSFPSRVENSITEKTVNVYTEEKTFYKIFTFF